MSVRLSVRFLSICLLVSVCPWVCPCLSVDIIFVVIVVVMIVITVVVVVVLKFLLLLLFFLFFLLDDIVEGIAVPLLPLQTIVDYC